MLKITNQENEQLQARFSAYIKLVIVHAKIDYLRKSKYQSEISFEELKEEPYITFEQQYITFLNSKAAFDFEEVQLAEAFSSLSLIRQQILTLLFAEELSPAQVADQLHCPIKVVYREKYRALQKLRKFLRGDENE